MVPNESGDRERGFGMKAGTGRRGIWGFKRKRGMFGYKQESAGMGVMGLSGESGGGFK